MRNLSVCAAVAAVALVAVGCAKEASTSSNEETQRFYNAWVKVQKEANPDYLWLPFSYGTAATSTTEEADYAYILEDIEGDGEEVPDSTYLFVTYTTTDLYGNVEITTDKTISHRTGVDYDPAYYYGPVVWVNLDYYINVAIYDMFAGLKDGEQCYDRMKVGGRRKVVIPGWLNSSIRYETTQEYLDEITGTDYIYDVTLEGYTDDILQYQIDSIESYFYRHYGTTDSVYTGFYFKTLVDPVDTIEFEDDTTIYINYIGRLLNGQVFDTNIADTAKVWNLYDATETYAPAEVNWSSDSTDVTLDESSTITGFASMIKRMGAFETAVGVFYSSLGYGSSGSDNYIPGYAPLEFEIRIVEEEEDD